MFVYSCKCLAVWSSSPTDRFTGRDAVPDRLRREMLIRLVLRRCAHEFEVSRPAVGLIGDHHWSIPFIKAVTGPLVWVCINYSPGKTYASNDVMPSFVVVKAGGPWFTSRAVAQTSYKRAALPPVTCTGPCHPRRVHVEPSKQQQQQQLRSSSSRVVTEHFYRTPFT